MENLLPNTAHEVPLVPSGAEVREPLDRLSDEEFLQASQEFGNTYAALVRGEAVDDFPASAEVQATLDAAGQKLEGLDESQRAKVVIGQYRSVLREAYEAAGHEPPIDSGEPDEAALASVTRVEQGPYGTQIVYTNGKQNEALFGSDSLAFAASEAMLQHYNTPIVVVYEGYGDNEKQEVMTHETSHAVWGVLRASGVIPSPQGEDDRAGAGRSAFELARDEAAALMVAGQRKIVHSNVVTRMEQEGYSAEQVERYRALGEGFNAMAVQDKPIELSSALLGIVSARTFDELEVNMTRLARLTQALPGVEKPANDSAEVETPDEAPMWTL
ncbi:MAG TPA: hypothetical protein VK694_02125 [Verrucomicrobiae bacterium]|nr:hypothetical protein [Verrucomicrobiae bacterium]